MKQGRLERVTSLDFKHFPESSIQLKRTSLKTFFIVVISGVIILFLFSALLTVLDAKLRFTSSAIKEWSSNVPTETLVRTMGFENPYFTQVLPDNNQLPLVSSLALELVTSVKPGDIRSLLGSELPGFEIYDSEIIVAGAGTNYTNLTHESAPPIGVMMKEREVATEKLQKLNKETNHNPVTPPVKTTGDKNVVYIYATHNTESFLPVLKGVTDPDSAYSSKINVIDVTERLGQELENRGIGTIVNQTSFGKMIKNDKELDYYDSYQVSRNTVAAAINKNSNIQLVFDIHRDSLARKYTTATINGKKYARVMFVVGQGNPDHEKNTQMAKKLHDMLDKKYPGLSRGVEAKNKNDGNGVYNQDLSNQAMLIEIGGVGNSMKELYRTADALAEIIKTYYWQQRSQKVSG